LLRLPNSSFVQVGGKQERFFWRLGFQAMTATACKVAWIQAISLVIPAVACSHIASTTPTHSAQMALNRFLRSTNIVIVSSLMQLDRNLAPAGLVPLGRSTGPATLSTALTSRTRRCSAHLS